MFCLFFFLEFFVVAMTQSEEHPGKKFGWYTKGGGSYFFFSFCVFEDDIIHINKE